MTAKKADSFGSELQNGEWGSSGELRATVWPNIHGLCETNGAETFRAEELPLCQEVWIRKPH